MAAWREAHPVNPANPVNPVQKERQDFRNLLDERDCALRRRARGFLPRRREGTKEGGSFRRAWRVVAIRNENCLARSPRSSRRGGRLLKNGEALWQKGRRTGLPALPVLHSGYRLWQNGGVFLAQRRGDAKKWESFLENGGCLLEKGGRLRQGRVSIGVSVLPIAVSV